MTSLGRRTTELRANPQGLSLDMASIRPGAGGAAPPQYPQYPQPPSWLPQLPQGANVMGGTSLPDIAPPTLRATPYTKFQGPAAPTWKPRDPGQFVAPDPNDIASDPYYQFRTKEGQDAIQASAAAHGTLLGGNTLRELEKYRQGVASEEAGKSFDRALQTFNTNTNATLGYNTQGMNAAYGNYDRTYDAARDVYGDQNAAAHEQTGVDNANAAQTYADQIAQAKARLRAR